MLSFFKKREVYKPFSDLSQTVIINSIVSMFFAIIVIVFSLVRTSLIAQIWGEAGFGLLAIAIGILPFINSTHGGVTMVSRYNLYDKVYKKQYDEANQTIANLKIQYFFFGTIYGVIALILAFAFPFFFSNQGNIAIETQSIPWWQSTLYILSNCIEALSNYFIFPISIIIFFVVKKSYITNSINSILATILNGIVIALLVCQKTGVINLDFLIMNIIISAILGVRVILLVLILKPIRNKKIDWYEKKPINNKRISKDMVISTLTEYFKQFNNDLYSIVFIILTVVMDKNHSSTTSSDIALMHAGHGSGLEVGGIYVIFLTLITYSYEIVHTIVDAAIPSMAEHVTINKKIHNTFFKRYNSLAIFIATYCITTYIFTILFSSRTMMNLNHLGAEEFVLMFIITIPFYIDIRASSYDHIVPVYGEFKKSFYYNMIKSAINVVCTSLLCTILCFNIQDVEVVVYISIIFGWTIASSFYYFINKRFVDGMMEKPNKFELGTFMKQNMYIFSSLMILMIVVVLGNTVFSWNEVLKTIGNWSYLIICFVGLINFAICFINMKYSCKPEYNYYLREWICFKKHLIEIYHPIKCECDCQQDK